MHAYSYTSIQRCAYCCIAQMRKNANIWITGQTHVFSSRGNATLYASVGAFTHCLEKAELLEQFWRGPILQSWHFYIQTLELRADAFRRGHAHVIVCGQNLILTHLEILPKTCPRQFNGFLLISVRKTGTSFLIRTLFALCMLTKKGGGHSFKCFSMKEGPFSWFLLMHHRLASASLHPTAVVCCYNS